ncbi:hypothetical protein PFISCL1PPCAC_17261, partial [Pristionchus fissidentatus]
FSQDDVLFGLGGPDPMEVGDAYVCGSPLGGDPGFHDHFRNDMVDHGSPNMHGLSDIPYHDNSLAVPMDDYQSYPNDLQGDSRDFQTLQPPVAYDMDMGNHSQSSMGMVGGGGYSNGGTTEGMMYEQTTMLTNGDHSMMGGEDHYGMMEMKPSTSFGSYQQSPLPEHHGSPSVVVSQSSASASSRKQSRPNSRMSMSQKGGAGGGGGGGGLAHHLNTPSTSNNYSNSPVLPVKTIPVSSSGGGGGSSKKAPNRQQNGRKSKTQGANSVGAVLTKVHKLAATPAAGGAGMLRFSIEETKRVAELSSEIERLQSDRLHDNSVMIKNLEDQRAAIFYNALSSSGLPTPTVAPPVQQRPKTSHKKQIVAPSSPAYTPQCGTTYTPHDSYGGGPGTSYNATPAAPPPMQRQMYKVATTVASAAPVGGPPMFVQQQQGGPLQPQQQPNHHGMQQLQQVQQPQMMTAPSTPQGTRKAAGGGRGMMMRPTSNSAQQQPHPSISAALQQHPPGTTVRAALKQSALQHVQQHNMQQLQQQQPPMQQMQPQQQLHNHQQQLQQGQQQHQQHHMVPSTSAGPQPLLQLSLPVQQLQQQPHHQQQHQMRMDEGPTRLTAAQTARKMEERLQSRKRRMTNTFEVMSAQLLQPETELPFAGIDDIFRRLMPYHLLYEHDLDPQLEEEFDLQYLRAMVDADERKRRLISRMQRIAINEAVARKDEELNLLLFLDANYEKSSLEEERKMAKEEPDALISRARATALSLAATTLPPPSTRLAALKRPEGPAHSSLYESHPFVERRRIPTPPPLGVFHGLEESEVEDETEEDEEESSDAAAAAAPSGSASSAAPAASAAKKAAPESDDDEQASPEMGVPEERPTPPTRPAPAAAVPTISRPLPTTVPSNRPRPSPSKVHLAAASPARAPRVPPMVAVPTRPSGSKGVEAPAAHPPPLAVRNRMMEDRLKEEERRKKVEEREERAAEERKKKEEER